jgi:hypothetical protein
LPRSPDFRFEFDVDFLRLPSFLIQYGVEHPIPLLALFKNRFFVPTYRALQQSIQRYAT